MNKETIKYDLNRLMKKGRINPLPEVPTKSRLRRVPESVGVPRVRPGSIS